MYASFFKRLIDIFLATVLVIASSPILTLTWLILFWQNSGKPFFYQERPGYKQKPFVIIKFKTMSDRRDEKGKLLSDNARLTKMGRWVRKLSIDELPQLFNVLKGDMSLVGPRPLLFKYIPLYSIEQLKRHDVRPGITGWAQVNGRNSIPWKEKFKYDIEYVEAISLSLDLKILWLTLLKVIKREGINQSAERPMEPFNGSN